MGRIPAAIRGERPASFHAPSADEAIPARLPASGDDTHAFQLLPAPFSMRLARPRPVSLRWALGQVVIAALGSGAAILIAGLLLPASATAATAALVLAVMLGAWRGFWPGLTAALLTATGLTVLLITGDGSRPATALDLAAFAGIGSLVLLRCGWQERRALRFLSAALHDPLTGLPNRAALLSGLDEACSAAAAGRSGVALVAIDIDDFKAVNDRFGHGAGDELLCAVAGRLAARLRPGDLAARQGGDEFSLLLGPGATLDDAVAVAARILAALDEPFLIRDHTIRITASAGVARAHGFDAEAGRLLEQADTALYRAKHSGKARAVAYRPDRFDAGR